MTDPRRHSRVVAVVKVALPLLAVALLVALFGIARGPGRDGAPPLPEDALSRVADRQRAVAPLFRSTTEDARPLTVAAETAVPRDRDNSVFDLTEVAARLTARDGGLTTLAASMGTIDRESDLGVFTGDVRIATPDGYDLRTDRLEALLTGERATSPGPVRIEGPDLRLDAGAMDVLARDGRAGRHVVFTGGVRLLYDPQQAGGTP